MANRKGLGVSKKYANGTIHETATGKFIVLDRFAEEDDDKNTPMLEFQWTSGEKEGKIEVNREMNMAASIHKFQTSRGKPTIVSEPQRIEHNVPFMEKIDASYEMTLNTQKGLNEALNKLDMMFNIMQQQEETIARLTDQMTKMADQNTLLNKQQDTLNKLIEKM